MSNGQILQDAPYHQLLNSSQEFQDLVNAHKETSNSNQLMNVSSTQRQLISASEIRQTFMEIQLKATNGNQLIKQEERERDRRHRVEALPTILQNSWMAANVDNPHVSTLQLIVVYSLVGVISTIFLLVRCQYVGEFEQKKREAEMKIEDVWSMICGDSGCLKSRTKPFSYDFIGELSLKATSDVLIFLGAFLMLLCTYKTSKCEDTNEQNGEELSAPLNVRFNEIDPPRNVTPFAKAGFFSRMSFWWLNSLMKRGKEKTLQDEDMLGKIC
ncbi:unnamed protein product [Sphenostylis stenocarpa]|uniref:Uncharacterized protein n=1 Tax=Sphenostylis stenocarpa TaxID=92480 RepID=A0AA86SDL7_9FABA|nr:unnamed protein product [Sphenostylis stenocarpa]